MPEYSMNDDIAKFPIYLLNSSGQLIRIYTIKSTADYDHSIFALHHFIKRQDWERNEEWYRSRGIEQKLILMRHPIHEQLHFIAVKNMSDEEFEKRYKIPRKDLIFSRKTNEY